MQGWLYLVVVGTAIWVAADASHLSAKRGALGGGLLDMGPASWFFACLLLWIVALPCYLAVRPKLVRRAHALATHPQFAAVHPHGMAPMSAAGPAYGAGFPQTVPYPGFASPPAQPAPAAPPPGWYPNPQGYGMRWWDGTNWTDHTS